ncbi:MAG: serine/threonine protein kinase, partial [Pyrinomonadaceae bacterium]
MPPQKISHYNIINKIGDGGMGEVYLAEDPRLGRQVAVKILIPESLGDVRANKRFIREAQAAASLDHPNICAVHEAGEENGYS